MKDKEFRLDFFIAVGALLVSVLTTLTLIYQTHVISQQYAATIWPYLSTGTTADPNGFAFDVANDGLGPALIQSAQISLDGVVVPSWGMYLGRLTRDPTIRRFFMSERTLAVTGRLPSGSGITSGSLGPGTTIRPGDKVTLFRIHLQGLPVEAMQRHALTIDICYCSLNSSCWTIHNETKTERSPQPKPVSQCTTTTMISAALTPAPSPSQPPSR